MKKIFSAVVAFCLLACLCGCSFEPKSIDSLMRPPQTATELELEKSINTILGNNISLRSPASGSYHSAITLHDLDADRNDEAIVFYVNNNDTSAVRMCVLKKNSEGWQLVSDFAGNGSGIYSIDFYDLNNDGGDDMLVSWYLFEDKINKTLTVYSSSRSGNEISFSACATEPYNLLCVEDVFSTGEKQIILGYTDSAKQTGKNHIRLMSLNSDNRVVLLSETRLDDAILSLSSIKTDRPNNGSGPRIFVDAIIPDSKMITEILVWNSSNNNFKPLLPSASSLSNSATARSNNLYSFDIDNDSLIEIPKREALKEKGSTSVGYVLVWYSLENGKMVREHNYFVNIRDNYKLYVSDELFKKIYVRSDNENSTWDFVTSSGDTLFSIIVYDLNEWNNNKPNVTETLLINNDKVYACKITEKGKENGVSSADLVKYFSLNN